MCFLLKKLFDDEKKIIYMIGFLCQVEVLLLNMLKFPGFFRFTDKVATL